MKSFKKFLREYRKSFTLAEVVIVMAILSIMMVAFAPVITKKSNTATDSFRTFQRTVGNHGVYYGTRGDTKPVVIGDTGLQYDVGEDGYNPKMVVVATTTGEAENPDFTPQIGFIAGTRASDTRYATGQLLIAGGFTNVSDVKAMNIDPQNLMPIAYATDKPLEDGKTEEDGGDGGEGGDRSETGTGGNGNYSAAVSDTSANISVILGGNPVNRYPWNVGTKNMTIVGGNACPGAIDLTGTNNDNLTCLGANSGRGATLGANNVLVGANSGARKAGQVSNSVLIGQGAGASSYDNTMDVSNSVAIGDGAGYNRYGSNSVYIGYHAGYIDGPYSDASAAANNVFIGNSGIQIDYVHIGNRRLSQWICDHMTNGNYTGNNTNSGTCTIATSSDERLKNVGKPFDVGLELLNKIEPINFTYKRDENKFPHVGVIAQDLAKIFPNAVSANKDGYLYIRTEDMFYAAINAIKELYQMFLSHDKSIKQLEARNAVLEQQNRELLDMYTELAKRVERLDKKKSKPASLTPMPIFTDETQNEEASTEEVNTEE